MAQVSIKRQQIEKSISTMVVFGSVTIFLLIFCLVSAHSLYSKMSYQKDVISADTTAKNQLSSDVSASSRLDSSYEKFDNTKTNLLGASVSGKDNDNAKIILDALPSGYDYPALTTSLENLLSNQGVTVDSIGGSDESATVSQTGISPIDMPFTFSIDGPYQDVQSVVNTFEKSIRPFQFQTMDLSGNQSDVTLTVTAQTFFQPSTTFNISKESIQ